MPAVHYVGKGKSINGTNPFFARSSKTVRELRGDVTGLHSSYRCSEKDSWRLNELLTRVESRIFI